jgi:RNase adaptor protein for sRNA GlmZ degradation
LPEYVALTGCDSEVADYIAGLSELEPFWENARSLTEAHVEAYQQRGFTSLSVSFGCTGGQHRSVYLAEKMAQHLEVRFPTIRVRLLHREEPSWPRVATTPAG